MLEKEKLRPTLYDYLPENRGNKFCLKSDLEGNESRVESFFLIRLFSFLGYKDADIRTKDSVEKLKIPKGRQSEYYRPDYVLFSRNEPRIVADAKSTTDNVNDWINQCSGYCLVLNRRYTGEKPVKYYLISNGLITKIFNWDEEKPILELQFEEFIDGNEKFIQLQKILSKKTVSISPKSIKSITPKMDTFLLLKPDIEKVKRLFVRCHREIWKTEKKGPQSAFFEFAKLMFIKTYEDRRLHNDAELKKLLLEGKPIPADKVQFSRKWIESLQTSHDNPIDALLFQRLMEQLEDLVARGEKKRIFESNEKIRLSPGTIKEVISKLEHTDLWGIDEDLNGRLFETFLSATMRGQDLGQYFTPRTIVKFMTKMAEPKALNKEKIDIVIDACCGTGGFLIEVLTDMRQQVRSNYSLSDKEQRDMLKQISDNTIFGIDAGTDPPIARIARLNMYLHGDGGSRIYATDALDKKVNPPAVATVEEKKNTGELRDCLLNKNIRFNLAITNPPFSMDYSEANSQEAEILKQYNIASAKYTGTSKRTKSLRAGVMFFERYYDLLVPGGRLVTVIDDSILANKNFKEIRDWIREKFIVKAIISLPGDAFQRAGARAKTSILYLIKKEHESESQPNIFMAEAQSMGIDDLPPTSRRSRVIAARMAADKETQELLKRFKDFSNGKRTEPGVLSEKISDRMDVKFCSPRKDDVAFEWKKKGYKIVSLEELVQPIWESYKPSNYPEKPHITVMIGYDGVPVRKGWTGRLGKEISYDELMELQSGLLVLSHINAAHGSIAIIPKNFGETYVTPEYTILKVDKTKIHPTYLWAYLRSPEARARMLSDATGMGRTRVDWKVIRHLPIPIIKKEMMLEIAKFYDDYLLNLRRAKVSESKGIEKINAELNLNNKWAEQRLKSAKPPR